MFRYTHLFFRAAHFPRCKFGNKLCPSFPVFYRNFNGSKNYFYNPVEINGFHKLLSIKQKVLEFKSLEKYMSKISDIKCWNCKKTLELRDFSCTMCGALQHPKKNINFFELLGVSQSYEINLDDLSKKYRNLQMKFHPDKFANRTKDELEISEIYSRLINKAYTTVKHPVLRGFYLLELQNISRESYLPLEQDFLTAIMERNEELDVIENVHVLKKFMTANNELIQREIILVQNAFHSNKLDDAKVHLLKLNYLTNLDNKIKEKHNSLMQNHNL